MNVLSIAQQVADELGVPLSAAMQWLQQRGPAIRQSANAAATMTPAPGVEAIEGIAAASVGAPGDMEYLVRMADAARRGAPLPLAMAQDPYLPTTDEVGGLLGGDPDNPLFQAATWLGFDPAGPFGKAMGALSAMAPVAVRMGKKNAKKKGLRHLWDSITDYDEALDLAAKGGHLRRDPKTGQYIGAPRGVDSPQKLAALRRKADQKVDAGAYGMGWYNEARETATRFAPNDPGMQSLFSRGGAAYSPQATPANEVNSFVQQHNAQMLTGQMVRPRTEAQMRNVAQAYRKDGSIAPYRVRLGKKTGPYGEAKDPTVTEGSLYRTANDIWHGRVMGYGEDFNRGFTPEEHAFLTGENLLLAQRAAARDLKAGVTRPGEWNPRAAQAATWAAQREQAYIAKELAKIPSGQTPDMARITAEARQYASSDIKDAAERNTAFVTSEARTGRGVDHLWMDDPDQIQSYTDLVMDQAAKRDPIADPMRMYTADARPTQGQYVNSMGELEMNPGFVNETLVSSNLSGAPFTMPADREALDLSALLGGVLRGQEAGAWSRFFPEGMGKQRVGGMNAVLTEPGVAVEGFDAINYPNATLITRFGDAGPVPNTTKDILAGIPGDTQAVRGTVESGYEPTLLSLFEDGKRVRDPGSGQATENLLSRFEAAENVMPGVSEKTARVVAQQARAMNEIDRAIAATTKARVRDDLFRLRDVLSQGGIPALRDWVKKNGSSGLPAAVLGLAGVQSARSFYAEPEGV